MKNIVCLKWGNKYAPEYVNRLYNMVKRNMRSDFRFVCFTEDTTGIDPEIETKPLLYTEDSTMKGWWHKLSFFLPEVSDLKGKMLFLDLDVTINSELDCFFDRPGPFNIIWEWRRLVDRNKRGANASMGNQFNSSVFMMEVGSHPHVWTNFLNVRPDAPDLANIPQRQHAAKLAGTNRIVLHGDQDWLNREIKEAEIWPEGWVASFKQSGLDRNDPNDCKIAVFHGHPDPHEAAYEETRKHIVSPWILSTWRENNAEVKMTETATSAVITIEDEEYSKFAWNKCVDNSLTSINATRVLGSLRYNDIKEKIKLWYNRLERGGILNIVEDDFSPMITAPTLETLDELCAMQSPISVYSFEMIKIILESSGFKNVTNSANTTILSISCEKE